MSIHICRLCKGTGRAVCPCCGGDGKIQGEKCYYCQGDRTIVCPACGGKGYCEDG